MAVLLEGAADLVIICCWVILIGTLLAVLYTFVAIAHVFDVSILGYHPFRGISHFIQRTIIHWCEVGIHHLEGIPVDLLHGMQWQNELMGRALHSLAVAVEHSLGLLRRRELPGLIRAAVHPVRLIAEAAQDGVQALWRHIAKVEATLQADIQTAERTAIRTAERYADTAISTVEADLSTAVRAVTATLEGELGVVAGELGAAERTIAARLSDLENLIKTYGLPAALAMLALLQANVLALEAETGLDSAECRSRVKGLCGVDPNIWADLLAGLALLEFSQLSLRGLVPPARQAIGDLTGIVQGLA